MSPSICTIGAPCRRLPAFALALGLPAMVVLLAHPSHAASAFAAGIPDDVASQGIAVGAGYNYGTQQAAEERALNECHQQTGPASSLCKIIDHFDNRCLSVSWDPKPGTPGWGWSIADTADAANDQALSLCRNSSSPDRAPYCTIDLHFCDGTAVGR